MQTFEFQGKTPEDAIETACQQLKISKDGMDIEIIEPGAAGIFGLVGNTKAKIKVTIPTDEVDEIEEKDVLAIAKKALEDILTRIPMENTSVKAEWKDGTILLNIEGDKSGLLIGRKGRTLDALQYIVNKIVNKALKKRSKVVIDSENYRQRRQDFLIQMAMKLSDKAKKIRKPVATNLLNPHDRRIIHIALREDEELDTKSRGEGILKKILVIPKKIAGN
jgi:spoIIIJ-associated protein